MIEDIYKEYEYPRSLDLFRKFIAEKQERIRRDIEVLIEQKKITKERFEKIKEEIRKVFGENIEYISTTLHLRPRAIDYLELAQKRISQAVKEPNKVFYYPVYYQDFESERPDRIYFGSFSLSLCDIIPNLKKKFETSLEFHIELMGYLEKENWEEEVKNNLENFLNKEFSGFKKNLRDILIEEAKCVVISILRDYKKFFEEMGLVDIEEKINNINTNLANIFLNNFEALAPLLETLGISKEDLENIKERKKKAIGEFLFLVCILGELTHIGAEYGKFDDIRIKLGLMDEKERKEEASQERFRFFEVEGEGSESDTLRFLFDEEGSKLLIQTAKYMGHEESRWSPISEKLIKRIRIIDFYLKVKSREKEIREIIENYLENSILNWEGFVELLELVNYFAHLKNEERAQLDVTLKEIQENNVNKKLREWINYYNKKIKEKDTSLRFLIHEDIFKRKILWFVFKNYIEGEFMKIKVISEDLFTIFLSPSNLEKFETEKLLEEITKPRFYGLQLPLRLPKLNKEDLINLVSLFTGDEKIQPFLDRVLKK